MILSILLLILAGIANGLMDLVSFKWYKVPRWIKQREKFWNPEVSWLNKWSPVYAAKERFFLSSTVLVFLTDGWHLCKEIMLSSIALSIALQTETPLIWFLISRMSFGIGFYITYKK